VRWRTRIRRLVVFIAVDRINVCESLVDTESDFKWELEEIHCNHLVRHVGMSTCDSRKAVAGDKAGKNAVGLQQQGGELVDD